MTKVLEGLRRLFLKLMSKDIRFFIVIVLTITAVILTTSLLIFHFKSMYTARRILFAVFKQLATQPNTQLTVSDYDAQLVSLARYVDEQGDLTDKLKYLENDYASMSGRSNVDQFINAAVCLFAIFALLAVFVYFKFMSNKNIPTIPSGTSGTV